MVGRNLGRIVLITRKTARVVTVNVALDEPPIKMRWLREKPIQVPIVSKIT